MFRTTSKTPSLKGSFDAEATAVLISLERFDAVISGSLDNVYTVKCPPCGGKGWLTPRE
jgi:hypothetical protein